MSFKQVNSSNAANTRKRARATASLNSQLYRRFRKLVFFNYLFYFLFVILQKLLVHAIYGIVHTHSHDEIQTHQEDYREWLLPHSVRSWGWVKALLKGLKVSREKFVLIGLIASVICWLVYLIHSKIEETLSIESLYYGKTLIVKKFRRLNLENKKKQANSLGSLVEEDLYFYNLGWDKIKFKVIFVVFSLFLDGLFWWKELTSFNPLQWGFLLILAFSLGWSLYTLFMINLKNEEKSRLRGEEERKTVNQERNYSNLIEAMGLSEEAEKQQMKVFQKRKTFLLKNSFSKVLLDSPYMIIVNLLPFCFLFLGGEAFEALAIHVVIDSLISLQETADLLGTYKNYQASATRIDSFLALPEDDYNKENGAKLTDVNITSIEFKRVSFTYQDQASPVINNYNHLFTANKINSLQGENGSGKTTILYLILGLIKPQAGSINVHLSNGKTYNLADIDLKWWREKNSVFLSHETVYETGSTGQKQWKNFNQALERRKKAVLWILDEADNALDEGKRAAVQQTLTQLITEKKMVIYVRHPGETPPQT